jgi:geranylgeranyl reductase family protein
MACNVSREVTKTDATDVVDVAVAGAGPAGCWAARTLALLGARVTIIDGSHPREKPCGGGITGRALALVSSAIDRTALPLCEVRAARFVDSSRGTSTRVPLTHGDLVVASRTEFDGALVEAATAAGASVVRARMTDVAREATGFVVRTSTGVIRAQQIIGADGATSLVRRRFAQPFDRADLSIATGYFIHGVTSDEIIIELQADPPGYIWSFPRPTHLAVGICAQADAGATPAALRAKTLAWIRSMKLDSGLLDAYSWPIPSLSAHSFGSLTTSGPGWCLVGDAAGLVDPITREGIYFALLSGEWAARAIAATDGFAGRQYHERVCDEIGAELSRAARFKAGFFQPRFTQLLVDALDQSPRVRGVMAGLVAGTQPYATLRWSLARTAEIGLAWRLIRSKWYNHHSFFKE